MAIKVMVHPALSRDLATQKTIDNTTAGFIGWNRLHDILRDGGEVTSKEEVEAFILTDTGIQFYVKRR